LFENVDVNGRSLDHGRCSIHRDLIRKTDQTALPAMTFRPVPPATIGATGFSIENLTLVRTLAVYGLIQAIEIKEK
jgi:hypothetical protein